MPENRVSLAEQKKDTVRLLTIEMSNAQTNMTKFADSRDSRMAQYYAGMRDGLERALDIIDPAPKTADERISEEL